MIRKVGLVWLPGVSAACLMLCGCGGGGGVQSTPTPTPTPSPTPTPTPPATEPTPPVTPTPTPTPAPTTPSVNFNDAEYQRSNAASAANAIAAYSAGAFGAGVKVAILDSGIADPLGEFTGRIDPASRDVVGNRGITDTDGHGTSVAAVAAAARDGAHVEGLAFQATLLVLKTDDPGSCANDGKCNHTTGNLATAMDIATQNGARVVNLSLGGAPAGTALTNAINRATAAGVIVVISAGNEGASDPDQLAQVAATAAARGLVIIAGSHDANYTISSFSDRAGNYAAYYLTALGSRVLGFDQTGGAFLFSGTSYSAPAISGAVALLAGAFPNLTGAQIVNLLYSTASDAGDAGVDAVYGRGILNLTRAFQPQGSASLAGGPIAVSLDDNATLGTAMGDAAGAAGAGLGRTVILDSYGRAYSLDLAGTMRAAASSRPLIRAIGGNLHSGGMDGGGFAVSMTVSRDRQGEPWAGLAQRGLTRDGDTRSRPVAGAAFARLDARTAAAFAFGTGGASLAAQLGGVAATPFLVARSPDAEPGFETRRTDALALRRAIGGLGLTLAAEHGGVAALTPRGDERGYDLVALAVDRRFGPLRLNAGGGMLREAATVLGARFGAALGGGAVTRLLDLGAHIDAGAGWRLGGRWRRGWTRADGGSSAIGPGRLTSAAYAVDVVKQGLLARSDRIGLRLAQPLRVASGGYWLNLPVSYDYASGAVGYATRRLDLAPQGRERDVELAYGRAAGRGWIDANFYLRIQPGNYAAAPDDRGLALRYTLGF